MYKFWIKDVPLKVSSLQPDFVIYFERGEPGLELVSHELLGQFVCSKGLISCFFKVSESFFQSRKTGGLMMLGMACGSYPNMR